MIDSSARWTVKGYEPRFDRAGKSTGRDIYIEPDGDWGDAAKDIALVESAPYMRDALRAIANMGPEDAALMSAVASLTLAKVEARC